MKIFIDSAQIQEIREANALGLLDGVTTNPSLIAKTGKSFDAVAKEICNIVQGPVNLEVVGLKTEEMLEEAKKLRLYGDQVVIKIPMTADGLKAVKILSEQGVSTNVTLIFQAAQAYLAAKAGATYVSPFVGRLDDISESGMNLVKDILTIYRNYEFPTQVLVASVRHPLHVIESLKMGAHVATLPLSVIQQLTKHPLTDTGLKKFLDDWNKTQK